MVITALREIGIGVADLERRSRWYCGTFGLSEFRRGTLAAELAQALYGLTEPVPFAVLGRPDIRRGVRLRLLQLNGGEGRPERDLRLPGPVGIGFTTTAISEAYQRLLEEGVQFLSPPVKLTPGAQPTDPFRFEVFGRAEDGEYLVLIERGNAPTPYGTIASETGLSEPLHTSHSVPDLAEGLRFLEEALGQVVLFHEHCAGPLFEQLMGLPAGQEFDFDMLGTPGFATGRIVLMDFAGLDGEPATVQPPQRGICTLRYDTSDLAALLPRLEPAGGRLLRGPLRVNDPVFGRGQVVTVMPPLGTLIELWEPDLDDNPSGGYQAPAS
jgi:catechol 2,3-dioxygenase-like lactoylglutathione lyase family enzyme